MKTFRGKVLFLDRNDINTDEIIPARYLTEIDKQALGPHLLEDLELEGFSAADDIEEKGVIITRANFGCGSSREHAPWALEMNGINLVIAESFARIFRQNMFNCGMLSLEYPAETIQSFFSRFPGSETLAHVDLKKHLLILESEKDKMESPLTISDFDRSLVEAGGWVEFADQRY